MKTNRAMMKRRDGSGIIASIVSIVFGLIVGFIVLLAAKPSEAVNGFAALITGGFFSGMKTFGNVLYYAVPIIMTGLGVGFAFKASIFNIGGSGQFLAGGFCALYVALNLNLPGALGWIVPLLASMAGGALWALLPGFLYAYRKVNIVIATIMMNYIGLFLFNYLIKNTIYDALRNQTLPVLPANRLPTAGLDKLFPGSVANCGIFIAILMAVAVYILLKYTVFGFELKSCGKNRDACIYAGVNAKRNIMLSMLISGALIGLGAALMYLSSAGKHIKVEEVLPPEGFNGIPVALLAMNNPIGTIFSGLFIAYLQVSGFYMQAYGFTTEIVDIITSVIIYCSAFALIINEIIRRWHLRSDKADKAQNDASGKGGAIK